MTKDNIKVGTKRAIGEEGVDWIVVETGDYQRIDLTDLFEDSAIAALYFSQESIQAIYDWARRSLSLDTVPPEVGGILFGKKRQSDDGFELAVELFEPIKVVDKASNVELVIGSGFPQAVNEAMTKLSNPLVIGWFHTHPGHSPFLSRTDLERAHIFFPHQYQFAMVLDPLTADYDTGIFPRTKEGAVNNASDQSSWIEWASIVRGN